MQEYCIRCRSKRDVKDAKPVQMKNGQAATQCTCIVCGTKIFRKSKPPAAPRMNPS